MPLESYGVLKGQVIESKEGRSGSTPHYQIKVLGRDNLFRIAVNVKSQESPSELMYVLLDDFRPHFADDLKSLPHGFTRLQPGPGGIALDYIRSNLFNPGDMKVIPTNLHGPDNDLNDLLHMYVNKAQEEEEAIIYAFGEPWGPENEMDRYFAFKPGNGLHNIHMNQGNVDKWKGDDSVWQDGGLIFYFPDINRYVGVFLAFQSQSFHTDDETGHAITPIEALKEVYIISALVNPGGADQGLEKVTLLNVTDQDINLAGWAISDKNKKKELLQDMIIPAGGTLPVTLSGAGAQLSNKGGQITLLDKEGLKVHGVSYTKNQTQKSGGSIKF
jgi:uncharacterized protein YukJ